MGLGGPIGRPSSLFLWGKDRPTLCRLALAFSRSVGPELYWFDIVPEDGSFNENEMGTLTQVPSAHAYRVAPPDVKLQDPVGKMTLWSVIRQSPAEAMQESELLAFLRIPDAIQRVVAEHHPDSPATLVVSNVDRAIHLFAGDRGVFSPYIQLLNRQGITLVFTRYGTPRANAADFEVNLRLEEWLNGTRVFRCENGFAESGFAPFRRGAWARVDELIRQLERLAETPGE